MESFATLSALLILCLVAFACVPNAFANSNPRVMGRLVTGLLGAEFLLALVLIISHQIAGGASRSFGLVEVMPDKGVHFSLFYDGATGLMLLLVGFVGFVVSRFSIRYLDREAAQGRYFRWLGFTTGAVSLMVVAGNLLLFFLAWVMTSLGLHQLLLHYRRRPAAQRAAWTKFAISRLGDLFLIAALSLTFKAFGTFELSELFLQVEKLASGSQPAAEHVAIAWLLMLGAVTKSAQFPFHVWLPDTMETPTPVSALMHAGIVNAGGYLVIRMSPLLSLAPESLLMLALVGAFTACFAGVVMMTQPSVKRGLAYSTIAQMGFMMLQCGLGAFSAAMLHIVAHSLYKAHAFLSSGGVASQPGLTAGGGLQSSSSSAFRGAAFFAAVAATTLAYTATLLVFGDTLSAKPGGVVLGFVMCLALTTWGWRLMKAGQTETGLIALAGLFGLCFAYFASYAVIDRVVGPTLPMVQWSPGAPAIVAAIAAAFAVLFFVHTLVIRRRRRGWLAPLRVHAANGFYVEAIYHRCFASLEKS